jgi:hypothetical protein
LAKIKIRPLDIHGELGREDICSEFSIMIIAMYLAISRKAGEM